ncbi:MAG: SDR family oxidoreductase [Candidatus Eisenbacteria sp.]|nr:SDR family oxidoreductase [Candidatus Eisenbacteria bacterium]
MKRCLITGGAGFIGAHLAEALVKRGQSVRILDDFSTGREENLSDIRKDVEVIRGDIRDKETTAAALRDMEWVFHLAAAASVPRSVKDPLGVNETNVGGTLNILMQAREAGVARLVYAASSSAYGESPISPKHEGLPTDPRSPYAASKLAGEDYCRAFFHVYGLETVCLRYFNVFGPRQDPDSPYAAVIPLFIRALLEGGSPQVFGDGEQTRDFTYVANVVDANLRAAEAPAPDACGLVINAACGDEFSLNQLLQQLGHLIGVTPNSTYLSPRPGDVRHSRADITRARQHLGYEPSVSFEEGLKLTVDWHLAHV